MRFGVLGPVVAWHADRVVPVGGPRERFVLVTLLLNAGRVTTAEGLIDALWTRPPSSARAQLHNTVSRLRAKLGDDAITTTAAGYELAPGESDLTEFRALLRRAREAADHAPAEAALTKALALWRGPALADVPDDLAGPVRAVLHDERLTATEALLRARSALGRHDEVLAEVTPLIDEHPYRERLYELRMAALAAVGRQAEALALYQEVYRRFATDLGVEPGAALRELEERILRGEPVRAVRAAPVPRTLPPAGAVLAGREKLHAAVTAAVRTEVPVVPPVAVLVGPGGVGKTALALSAAHDVLDHYPDGQLFADLRGSHRDPVDPHAVLGRFLRALGVDGAAVPDDADERVDLYRSTVAARRVLVVLDDAGAEAQVRPLLPGSRSCATVVTSRHRLGALLGAARWTVAALDPAGSLEVLATIAGRERVAAEPAAAVEIAELCGHLPLATCVAAARLAIHPQWTLSELRDRLVRERGLLDELALGDLDVRASIATSYRLLDPLARRLLRGLGLLSGRDWPAWVATEVLGAPAEPLLDTLAGVHLVEPLGRDPVGQNRFRLHDLVSAFAAERAEAEDPADVRDAALLRVLAGWAGLAGVADALAGHGMQNTVGLDPPTAPPDADGPAEATPLDWFEVELPGLVAAVDQAARLGAAEVAGELALRLSGFLAMRTYDAEREQVLGTAAMSARAHGADRHLVRLVLSQFGVAAQRGRFTELPALAAEALALARGLGDRFTEIGALGNAGWAAQSLGRLAEAADWYATGVATCDAQTPPALVRWLSLSLARTRHEAGHSAAAVEVVERLLAERPADESPRLTANLLTVSADVLLAADRPSAAEDALTEAAALVAELGDELGAAHIAEARARVHLRRGDWSATRRLVTEALAAHERLGVRDDLARTLMTLGELELALGDSAAAVAPLRRSLALWRELGAPLQVARTLARLDRCAVGPEQDWRPILADLGLTEAALHLQPNHN